MRMFLIEYMVYDDVYRAEAVCPNVGQAMQMTMYCNSCEATNRYRCVPISVWTALAIIVKEAFRSVHNYM